MKLPSGNTGWKVKHGADFFADLVKTKNLSFDRQGILQLAHKAVSLYNANDDANFEKVVAIVPDDTNGIYYVLTTGKMFQVTASPFAVAAVDTSINGYNPNFDSGSDAVMFTGNGGVPTLHVSFGTSVTNYTTGGYYSTERIGSLSSSYPHPMANFEDRLELSVGNGNKVQNYNASYTNNGSSAPWTLTIPLSYVVTSLRWKGGTMFVGTRHIYGGEAKVFVWNGQSASAPAGHGVGSSWVYSMCEYMGTIAVLNSAGQILLWTGSGFQELTHFPVYETPFSWEANQSTLSSAFGKVTNRGMQAFGDILYINIVGDVSLNAGDYPGNYLPQQPSGLWVYDPKVGLYHHAGHEVNEYRTLTITALSSDTLTLGTHSLVTGDPVFAQSVTNIAALTQYQTYFCIKVSDTTMKLALSRADALNGNAITLSGTPSGDTLRVANTSSYGSTLDTIAGAICVFTKNSPRPIYGAELFYGCEPADSTGTALRSLNSLGNQANRGYFITTPISTTQVQDLFQKIYVLITELLYDADAVVVKYRLKRRAGFPTPGRISATGLANWTSTTTFTIDSTQKDCRSVLVGDEVEMVSGVAAGCLTRVTAISGTSGTITFTVEDAQNVSNGDKSEVIFDDWKLMNTFTKSSNNIDFGYLESPTGDGSKNGMIQFKIEVRGYDLKIRSIESVSKVDKQAQ